MYKQITCNLQPHHRRTGSGYKFIRNYDNRFVICIIMYPYDKKDKVKYYNKTCNKILYTLKDCVIIRDTEILRMNKYYC